MTHSRVAAALAVVAAVSFRLRRTARRTAPADSVSLIMKVVRAVGEFWVEIVRLPPHAAAT